MTNYNLEKLYLLKWQAILSFILLGSVIISLYLTYNEILKFEKGETLFDENKEIDLIFFNRNINFIVSLAFLWINIANKNIVLKNGQDNLDIANIQVLASILSAMATLLILISSFKENKKKLI